jgi:hypothetical protein
MIATGDTTRKDPVTGAQLPTSRPLFTLQDRGTSLTGRSCAANASRLPNLGGTGGSSGSGKGPAGSGAGSLANSGGTLAAPLFGAGLLALGLAVLAARRRPGRGES